MNNDTILILLATYNGEAFLRQQLDSLLCQEHQNLQIIVSDDGSTDHTLNILESYQDAYPDKIFHYRSGQRFGCAQKHFMHLLNQFHNASYIMFCDQDDVWHPDKVSKTLTCMKQIQRDPGVPALVHTDLRVVDRNLAEIARSFCDHSGLDGNRLALNHLLVQNVVTGCTMMINQALAELACRDVNSDAMLMHDNWIAILAAACGVTGFLNEATIDYRQHGANSVGAKNVYSPAYLLHRLTSQKMRRSLNSAARQAASILDSYSDVLQPEQKELLLAFASTENASILKRNRVYLKYRLLKSGVIRVAAQLLGF